MTKRQEMRLMHKMKMQVLGLGLGFRPRNADAQDEDEGLVMQHFMNTLATHWQQISNTSATH